MNMICYNKEGYVALVTMLIVSAIAVSLSITSLTIGLSSSRSSFSLEQSLQAYALSKSCLEEALKEMVDNNAFTGGTTIFLGQGSCTYLVINDGGDNRTIEATGSVSSSVRRLQVTTDAFTPSINITSFEEVSDF